MNYRISNPHIFKPVQKACSLPPCRLLNRHAHCFTLIGILVYFLSLFHQLLKQCRLVSFKFQFKTGLKNLSDKTYENRF